MSAAASNATTTTSSTSPSRPQSSSSVKEEWMTWKPLGREDETGGEDFHELAKATVLVPASQPPLTPTPPNNNGPLPKRGRELALEGPASEMNENWFTWKWLDNGSNSGSVAAAPLAETPAAVTVPTSGQRSRLSPPRPSRTLASGGPASEMSENWFTWKWLGGGNWTTPVDDSAAEEPQPIPPSGRNRRNSTESPTFKAKSGASDESTAKSSFPASTKKNGPEVMQSSKARLTRVNNQERLEHYGLKKIVNDSGGAPVYPMKSLLERSSAGKNTGSGGSTQDELKKLGQRTTHLSSNNPFVPLGMLATTFCMGGIIWNIACSKKMTANYFMRARIACQFFTFVALFTGSLFIGKGEGERSIFGGDNKDPIDDFMRDSKLAMPKL